MTFSFRPAVRTQTPLLIGLAGPSRSGKTYSALRLATGLAQGQPLAMIDTESGRGLHYADKFKYLYGTLDAPFTSQRYLSAIEDAKAAGAKVIIVDSASHEHEGPGGMLEQHETELDRMAGKDWAKRDRMTFSAWIKPKAEHNKFVNRLLQMGADTHFIFCFRAKDKLILQKGKDPVHAGWTPICSSRFEFEMTSLLVLPEGAQGKPDLAATSSGLREPFDQFIKPGVQLNEELGTRLAEWASAGKRIAAPQAKTPPPPSSSGPLEPAGAASANETRTETLMRLCSVAKRDYDEILKRAGAQHADEMSEQDYKDAKGALERLATKKAA